MRLRPQNPRRDAGGGARARATTPPPSPSPPDPSDPSSSSSRACSLSLRASSGSLAAHAVATSGRKTQRYTCAMDPDATGRAGKCANTRSEGTPSSRRIARSVSRRECRGASSCKALIASQKSSGKMSRRTDAHCAHFTSAAPQSETQK